MIGSFEHNNIKSSTFELICKSVKRPLLPSVRPRSIEIFGKSGIIDYGDNDYNPRPIIMRIVYIGKSYTELRSRARDIADWLSTKQWARLIINDEPDKYYLARVINELDLDTLQRRGEVEVKFLCQPFAYMIINTAANLTWEEADFPWITPIPWNMIESYQFIATDITSFTFNNPGTKAIGNDSPQGSKFNITINGSWTTLEISLNGKTLQYTEAATSELVIDNVEMEVTLDGINKLSAINGDIDCFLSVEPGENTIEVNGTGLDITVTLDLIPMWI